MDELRAITYKYGRPYLDAGLSSLEAMNKFALHFWEDVAEIYDVLTRMRNVERNPTGFDLNDAPTLSSW